MELKTAKEVTKLQALAYEIRVEQAMVKEVISVSPQITMAEFGEVLRANRISGAPVVEDGRMVGVISIEDLIKSLEAGEMSALVGDRMTSHPETLYADKPLVHAVSKFSRLRFGRFPVVNQEGDLVGIITPGDVARAVLRRLEVDYHEEEIHRYRASHIFEDIIADDIALVFGYRVAAGDISLAGEASSGLKRTLGRLGIHPSVIRRVSVATYEAEMNVVIFTDGGEIVAEVRPERIKIEVLDKGPGIADIEQAMQPGFSTAPAWVQEMGFGAGMGLPNIHACSDKMQLDSTVGVGTHLEIIIYLDEK
ncbi:MAG: serine/threonine protein kinase [Chloroflexi bacterium]|nr:MAG: serine/threonine protein kinase [Chloroflexota bacterium]